VQFLRGFASRPLKVASVWPSSRDLGDRLAALPCLQQARCVVELGPGLGGTTRALLSAMRRDSRLVGIEIVEQFAEALRTIPDPRLHIVQGCALGLDQLLRAHRLPRPDVVISGIPFSALSREEGAALVRTIHALLPTGGTFVTYQIRTRVRELANELFGPARESAVLANIPPLRVFEWQKSATTCLLPDDGTANERPTTRSVVLAGAPRHL